MRGCSPRALPGYASCVPLRMRVLTSLRGGGVFRLHSFLTFLRVSTRAPLRAARSSALCELSSSRNVCVNLAPQCWGFRSQPLLGFFMRTHACAAARYGIFRNTRVAFLSKKCVSMSPRGGEIALIRPVFCVRMRVLRA